MKKTLLVLLLAVTVFACKNQQQNKPTNVVETYVSYGDEISAKDYLVSEDVLEKYNYLVVGDTINLKFSSTIDDVCSKKGCWMKLPVGKDEMSEVFVRFKDYGFFVPIDSKGKDVIVDGKGFVKEISVKELQHYAKDAGKSEEEIAKITEPKRTLSFEANGVLLKK